MRRSNDYVKQFRLIKVLFSNSGPHILLYLYNVFHPHFQSKLIIWQDCVKSQIANRMEMAKVLESWASRNKHCKESEILWLRNRQDLDLKWQMLKIELMDLKRSQQKVSPWFAEDIDQSESPSQSNRQSESQIKNIFSPSNECWFENGSSNSSKWCCSARKTKRFDGKGT